MTHIRELDPDRPLSFAERVQQWDERYGEQWLDDMADELVRGNDVTFTVRRGLARLDRCGVTRKQVWDDMDNRFGTTTEFRMAAKRLLERVIPDYVLHLEQDAAYERQMEAL